MPVTVQPSLFCPELPLLPWLSVYFSKEEHWTGKSSRLAYVNIQLFPIEFSPFKGQNDTFILSHVGPNQQWTSNTCSQHSELDSICCWDSVYCPGTGNHDLGSKGSLSWKERPGNETLHRTWHCSRPYARSQARGAQSPQCKASTQSN